MKRRLQSSMIINKMACTHQRFMSWALYCFVLGNVCGMKTIRDDWLLANSLPSFLRRFAQCVFDLLHNVAAAASFRALLYCTSFTSFLHCLCLNKDQCPQVKTEG